MVAFHACFFLALAIGGQGQYRTTLLERQQSAVATVSQQQSLTVIEACGHSHR